MITVGWVVGLIILLGCGFLWWWIITGTDPHDGGGL